MAQFVWLAQINPTVEARACEQIVHFRVSRASGATAIDEWAQTLQILLYDCERKAGVTVTAYDLL